MGQSKTKRKCKKIMKGEKGITLIALVITIIVLLILAAVALSMLTGENSVLKRGAQAKESTDRAQIIEEAKVEILGNVAGNEGRISETDAKEILGKYFNGVPEDLTELEKNMTTKNGGYGVKLKEVLGNTTIAGSTPVSNGLSMQELQEKASEYCGLDVLNYAETLPTNYQNTEWQLFYSGKIDDEDSTEADHIYLISKDYVPYSLLPAKNSALPLPTGNTDYKTGFSNNNSGNPNDGVIPQYTTGSGAIGTIGQNLNSKFYSYLTTNSTTSTYNNIKAVAYMLDTPTWGNFASSYADYAIGGPSVELLFKAYNKYKNLTGSSEYKTDVNSLNGYRISKDGGANWANYYSGMIAADTSTVNSPYIVSSSTNAYGYWLASPSAYTSNRVVCVNYNGYVSSDHFYLTDRGFRPVVCLKSNYTLEKTKDSNNNNAFNIVEKSE